jgi:hypothetical protein
LTNRQAARLAARASHARRPDPELESWVDSLDWTSEEGRVPALRDVAVRVAKGGLSAAQGNAIAALARPAANRPTKPVPPTMPTMPVVVEMPRYANGHHPTDVEASRD